MARRNNFNNPRKKRGGRKKGWVVLVILLIIALIGGYLAVSTYQEKKKRDMARSESAKPLATERHRMPEKKEVAPHQETYTAAVTSTLPPVTPKKKKEPVARTTGSVAIVIDDMGATLQELNSLMSLQVPLTFSVIPQLPHASEVAEAAHARGYEVMVHLPMEPQGYPQRRLEQNGLLTSLSDAEIERQVRLYLEQVPHAAGANNHMGSRFTEDADKMLPVLQVLKQKRLYFLDSKTTPLSVGYSLAHELGLKSGIRNVFLDNVQEIGAIRAQLQQAVRIARKRGYAIAICHPRKTTIEALARTLPELKAEGVTFVKVSRLLE